MNIGATGKLAKSQINSTNCIHLIQYVKVVTHNISLLPLKWDTSFLSI